VKVSSWCMVYCEVRYFQIMVPQEIIPNDGSRFALECRPRFDRMNCCIDDLEDI
jgi:hypothetical protein